MSDLQRPYLCLYILLLTIGLNLLKHMFPDVVFQIPPSAVIADFIRETCEVPVHGLESGSSYIVCWSVVIASHFNRLPTFLFSRSPPWLLNELAHLLGTVWYYREAAQSEARNRPRKLFKALSRIGFARNSEVGFYVAA